MRNTVIADYATVENCTRLDNGTVNSNVNAPVYIGDSVIAEDFIISSGAVVADAAKIIRCFIGQACHVTHNFSAHDSLLFSNCAFENGEACAIFAGPFTVSMHKSSLLIAGMYSFLNAGSGSNQSNHMYKLGPIHQGIVERGSKTTSDSYILWPARVGAFSLVMGRHHHHSDTSDMPFSYLIEKDDETYLVPGVNLRSVGTIRDAQKWPKRDKRTDQQRLDMINYNLLSPYTIYKMMKAVGILKNLQELVGETSEVYYYQNTRIKGSSLRTALDLYGMAINKFLGNSLIKRLEGTDFCSMEEVWSQLKPTSSAGRGEWLDLSGLILPREELDRLIEKVEEGEITSLEAIEEFFAAMHSNYYDMEWTWAYDMLEEYYGVNLSSISAAQIVDLVRRWQDSVIGLDNLLYKDAKKEFSLTFMTGFGVDGSDKEKQEDFEGVRGAFESNDRTHGTAVLIPRLATWMMFQYLFPQELAVDMRIDFGGGNLFMSQHLLDSKQVGSPFQQVGGEGMAERMRAHVLFDTGHFCLLLDDMKNHDPRQSRSSPAQEQDVFESLFHRDMVAVIQVVLDLLDRCLRDGDQALLAPFPFHLDESFVEINIREA